MKKALSFVLCLCMALSLSVFAVSAEVAAAEIADGAVIEFEDYSGEANKDLFVFTSETEGKPSRPYGGLIESDYTNEEGIGLSGGGALGLAERTGATGMTFTIPVSVTEPGWYDVEWYGSDGGAKGEWLSRYTVSVGENTIDVAGNSTLYFQPEKENIKGDNTDLYYYPIKLTKGRVFLTGDEENIVITALPNTNGESSGLGIKMVLDCVKFAKMELSAASWEKDAVMEMEEYIPHIRYTFVEGKTNSAGNKSEAKASGGAVMDMTERSNIQAMEFDIPVSIAKTGWYKINLVANNSDRSNTSILFIHEGDKELVNNNSKSGYAGSELLYFGGNDDGTYKYYGVYNHETAAYFTAGEHKLTASAVGITNNPNATKFLADCLKLSVMKTDVPAEGRRFELEDFQNYMSRRSGVGTNAETNETFLTDLGGATTGYGTVLNFEKSGYYTVKFHGSPYLNNGRSKINFYIDGDLILDNNDAKHGVNEGYDFAQYLAAWMFTNEMVYIDAGERLLNVEILARDPNNPQHLCAHASDYLEFIPVNDEAALGEGSVSVKAYFKDAVSGKAIVALYSDKEMVGVELYDEVDVKKLEKTVNYLGDKAPDTVKVMVWGDMDIFVPITEAKVITVK